MNTKDGIAVSTIAKYRKPNTPTVAAPIKYIFLRPMRSEMWPDSGIETNERQEATSTAIRIKSRDMCKVLTP